MQNSKSSGLTSALFLCIMMITPFQVVSADESIEAELRKEIAKHSLKVDFVDLSKVPDIQSAKSQLGKRLFYSTVLSGEGDVSCGSCHHPLFGGGDGLSLSVGAGAINPKAFGPARLHKEGKTKVPRNAPTLFNVALWEKVLFHDGRVEIVSRPEGHLPLIRTPDSSFGEADPKAGNSLLEAQTRFPTVVAKEMRGEEYLKNAPNDEVRNSIVNRVKGNAVLRKNLEKVYGTSKITYEMLSEAIAQFESSLIFIDSPWLSFLKGDSSSISSDAKKGALLFFKSYKEGGANCVECHTGSRFTDEMFHVLAVPQVGPGNKSWGDGLDDPGRGGESKKDLDRYAFRTPTLLNVEVTGPYGHDGVFPDLYSVVRHHLSPEDSIAKFKTDELETRVLLKRWLPNTMAALASLYWNRSAGRVTVQNVNLTDSEIEQIVKFLETLTDPCVKDKKCLKRWY